MNEKAPFLERGHVVKETKIGNSVCRICDDFCVKTPEEVDRILKNIGDIAYKSFSRKGRNTA